MKPPAILSFAASRKTPERFPQPPAGDRAWYAHEALRAIPRIILMIDKNQLSETYGCFDREYWHYRTIDFPCGMSQEFCLPLALAYKLPLPGNPYHGLERLKELVLASMHFARKSSHSDGTCDDYFPFERALGALVFSTYAMTESCLELDVRDGDLLDFFCLRGDWLLHHNETGQLANHQALAALALYNVYLLTGKERFRQGSERFRDLTLSWQNDEGWFQEYEGADPGYHSCSIAFLAKLWQKSEDGTLLEPLRKAIEFAAYFMHPDGSYGGEYGSRNTYHFYPHGFEVMARFWPTAARVAETYLQRSLPERRRYFNDDNRMCAHYVYDWMQSFRDYHPERSGTLEENRAPFTRWFPNARLLVKKTARYYAVMSLAKGGVVKVFDDGGPRYSDTGVMLKSATGEVFVSHLVDDFRLEVDLDRERFAVSGVMARRRHLLPTPLKQMAFRGMNLSVGRFGANAVRSTLQKILISGKPRTAIRFSREVRFDSDDVRILDTLDASQVKDRFAACAAGSDATSIYVANSNTFQESVLLPWTDLSEHVATLNRDRRVDLPERSALG